MSAKSFTVSRLPSSTVKTERKSKPFIFGAAGVERRWVVGLDVGVGDQRIGIEAADG